MSTLEWTPMRTPRPIGASARGYGALGSRLDAKRRPSGMECNVTLVRPIPANASVSRHHRHADRRQGDRNRGGQDPSDRRRGVSVISQRDSEGRCGSGLPIGRRDKVTLALDERKPYRRKKSERRQPCARDGHLTTSARSASPCIERLLRRHSFAR